MLFLERNGQGERDSRCHENCLKLAKDCDVAVSKAFTSLLDTLKQGHAKRIEQTRQIVGIVRTCTLKISEVHYHYAKFFDAGAAGSGLS